MSTNLTLEAVGNLLKTLLPGSVDVKAGKPVDPGQALIGVFNRDDGGIQVACVCDHGMVAFAGAALAMIPAPTAKASQASGQFPAAILENFREIMNISGQIVNLPGRPHVTFQALLKSDEVTAPELKALLASPAGRLDLEVNIGNYGVGRLSILLGT
jgi:hypothetical protein